MRNKFFAWYGFVAIAVLVFAVGIFAFSVAREARTGAIEADKSFEWISRGAVTASLSNGFMTDAFIRDLTGICQNSRMLSAVVVNTPSGSVYAWPKDSPLISYGPDGRARVVDTSFFAKTRSASLDIGDSAAGEVILTASLSSLPTAALFAASRVSFLIILALLLVTVIALVASSNGNGGSVVPSGATARDKPAVEPMPETLAESSRFTLDESPYPDLGDVSLTQAPEEEFVDDSAVSVFDGGLDFEDASADLADSSGGGEPQAEAPFEHSASVAAVPQSGGPEGLFSPVTGIGWEQYLRDRLDAELVRAASSELDLSLIIVRVSGLLHTDFIARKIADVLVETFRFRDMVFEFGSNGFAGIQQNVNLDEAMKTADALYAAIDSILMEMAYDGQLTIGITTRTARLLPAERMIDEALGAAKKAEEEPSLPIVAFRANPEKYRNFLAGKNAASTDIEGIE